MSSSRTVEGAELAHKPQGLAWLSARVKLSGAPGASVQLGQIHARPREASLQPASQVLFATCVSPYFVASPFDDSIA
jgi:hypothetical protein